MLPAASSELVMQTESFLGAEKGRIRYEQKPDSKLCKLVWGGSLGSTKKYCLWHQFLPLPRLNNTIPGYLP